MSQPPFVLQLSVRDYECDLQGVVNNAVYQNYLEHARHEFLKSHGVHFADVTRAGIHLVVVRAELDYRQSLLSGDEFRVVTRMEQVSRLKFAFRQDIIRSPDDKEMLNALITGVALNEQGRPYMPDMLTRMIT